ncbi:DKNYY domain-containing protein [Pseudoleptotrichia goodfellowii]|uniref:DKNYY domain-containing protein n=1 Tax=Pseudoleptotrichia goodfellowii TaxID=157692 RepID=UPI0009DF2BB9|nr:DKNYY domain-containing protein [Pseudoleptotrichia goodfellowii]
MFKKIDNADPETFTLIGNEITGDKNNIYYKDQKIKGIDRKSFKKFDYDFIKDKNGIYNFENENDNIVIKPLKIEDLDLDSFDMIIYGPRRTVNDDINFYRDKKSIYYREYGVIKRINGANTELFEALDEKFSTDESNVYYKEKKLSGIDADSFKTFEGNKGIFADKNGLYIINDKNKKTDIIKIEIKNVDLKSFERFENYFRDKNNVYYVDDNGMRVLNDADVKTFERFQQEYTFYKDKNNIYYEDKKLEGVDRKTFESTSLFGKDKSNIYYKNKKLGLTSKNFQIISDIENIFKNAEGIHLINDEDVKETGAENIKIVPMESKNVDLKTFENLSTPIFSTNYYKDKNNIYYRDGNKFIKVENVDTESFKVIDNDNAEDKNRKYFKGK